MSKKYLLVSMILVILAAAGLVLRGQSGTYAPPNKQVADVEEKVEAKPTEHVIGNKDAKVTLVEYGDYQCPACGAYYPIVKATQEKYANTLRFQFRNFPLTRVHPNALAAAIAAEAAAKQGKFWEMHDKLYETQRQWTSLDNIRSVMEAYAQQLGLDKTQFANDYANPATKAIVGADITAGDKLGIEGTPRFFLNGKDIESQPASVEDFSALIDAELAK